MNGRNGTSSVCLMATRKMKLLGNGSFTWNEDEQL